MPLQNNFNKPKRWRKLVLSVLLFCLVFTTTSLVVFSLPKPVQAGIPTLIDIDIPRITEWAVKLVWEIIKEAATVVYKKTLTFFLNKIAYDSAVYLASGGKGQEPLFWTGQWGKYIGDVADKAAGDALDQLSRSEFGFSVCDPPDAAVKLNLILKAKKVVSPDKSIKAKCTFSQAMEKMGNIKVGATVPDLRRLRWDDWSAFANYFDPQANDFGAVFKLSTAVKTKKAKDTEIAKAMRELNKELKSVTTKICDNGKCQIKTPSWTMKDVFGKGFADAMSKAQGTYTGKAVADAIGVFVDTFASKFMQRMIKGIVPGGGGSGSGSGPSFNEFGVGSSLSGTRAAQQLFAEFISPQFNRGETIELISTLSSCPASVDSRAYNNCVIDRNFATAIEQKLTLREAVEQNLIDGNKIFGFTSDNTEPNYNNGYPYTSLVILRKYRVIPVTWELAALYIRDVQSGSDIYTLQNLMDAFSDVNSPFYHLVDPNWVLKAQEFECRVQGPGEQIIQRTTQTFTEYDVGEDKYVEKTREIIQRNDYCADERSCVVENPDGTCRDYGYCTKELPIWKFIGNSCPAQAATCETFTTPEGQTASYLVNTLDTCDANQAGCLWYSAAKTFNNTWADDIDGDGEITYNDVAARSDLGSITYTRYFNNQVESCDAADEGCNVYYELTNIQPPAGYGTSTLGVYNYVQSTPGESYANWADVIPKFIKKPPANLYCPADLNDPLRDPECDNYAQTCDVSEVGCSLYTPLNGDPPIPAVAGQTDYCDVECVGYDQFLELATNFTSTTRMVNLIPATADSCTADQVGCEEFTNLDEVAQGGEGREFFTYIRHCILPDDPAAEVFYTWEGSDTKGYQLKTWHLEASGGAPNGTSCTPGPNNLDCRQFISASGNTYPRLLSTVVFATDDCHPYRRSLDGTVMNGIKSLSSSCSAVAVGCKEYRGNEGNVVNILFNDDFENGTNEGWQYGANSNESVYLDGHSLYTNNNMIRKEISSLLTQDLNYTLSFWAKSTGGNENVEFVIQTYSRQHKSLSRSDGGFELVSSAQAQVTKKFPLKPVAGTEKSFGSVTVGPEWNYYRVGPINLDRSIGGYEFLRLLSGADVYFDNIILREIKDNFYLISDSWTTPAACDQPFAGAQLGCEAYNDAAGDQVNLLGFTSLCSEQKVGCKALIDTQNTESPYVQVFNTENASTTDPTGLDDVEVPADNLVYLADNPDKYCNSEKVGCRLLGQPFINRQTTSTVEVFSDVYLIDFPENYYRTLCQADGLFCQEFGNERTRSSNFFIDPGSRACEYRSIDPVSGNAAGWYKVGSDELCRLNTVCSNNPQVSCQLDSDCTSIGPFPGAGGNGICILSSPDQPVHSDSVNYNGWAGLCQPDEQGCSRYLDPEGDTFCTNNQNVACQSNADCLSIDDYRTGNSTSSGVCLPHQDKAAYYYQEQTTDSGSCNGVVDREAGCLLFNKEDGYPQIYTSGAFSASSTPDGSAPIPDNHWDSVNGEQFYKFNDSNIILNVQKDRVCDQWLYCRTRIPYQDDLGNDSYKCFDIGLCEGVGDDNECNQFVYPKKVCNDPVLANRLPCTDDSDCAAGVNCLPTEIVGQQDQAVNSSGASYDSGLYSVEDLRMMSGYVKAGMDWTGYTSGDGHIDGLLPANAMVQTGTVSSELKNGDFEELAEVGGFINWTKETSGNCEDNGGNSTCDLVTEDNKVVSGLYSAKLAVIRSQLNPPVSTLRLTQHLNLPPGDYILSAYMRWQTVIGANAQATIEIIDGGTPLVSLLPRSGNSDGWEQVFIKFSNNSRNVDINLALNNVEEGDVFFDNVRLEPALLTSRVHDNIVEDSYIGQTCREYPENSSLVCDYTKGNPPNQKIFSGWKGYCLESYPKNPRYCVNWWPVDLVLGSTDIGEDPLYYEGGYPLYYCAESAYIDDNVSAAQGLTIPIFDQPFPISHGDLLDFPRYVCLDASVMENGKWRCNYFALAEKPTPAYLKLVREVARDPLASVQREYLGYSHDEFFATGNGVDSCIDEIKGGVSCVDTSRSGINTNTSTITSCSDFATEYDCAHRYCNTADGYYDQTNHICTSVTPMPNPKGLLPVGTNPDTDRWNCIWDQASTSCVAYNWQAHLTPSSAAPIKISHDLCSECELSDCFSRVLTCTYGPNNTPVPDDYYCRPKFDSTSNVYRGINTDLELSHAIGNGNQNSLSEYYGQWQLYKWSAAYRNTCDDWLSDTCNDPDNTPKGSTANRYNGIQRCVHSGSCGTFGTSHRMWWVAKPCSSSQNSGMGAWLKYIPGGNHDSGFNPSNWYPSPANPDFMACRSLALTAYENNGEVTQSGYYQRLQSTSPFSTTQGYTYNSYTPPYGAVAPATDNQNPDANPLEKVSAYVCDDPATCPNDKKWLLLSHPGCRIGNQPPYRWTNVQKDGTCPSGERIPALEEANGGLSYGLDSNGNITGLNSGINSILNQIFAKIYGIWEWDNGTYTYQGAYNNTLSNYTTNTLTSIDTKGQPIEVKVRELDNSAGHTVKMGGGTVQLDFTTEVNNNQLPLREYDVDWGDGTITPVAGSFEEKPSPADPHTIYHSYEYNTSTCGSRCQQNCTVAGITDGWTGNWRCFTPHVFAWDNWGMQYSPPPNIGRGGGEVDSPYMVIVHE